MNYSGILHFADQRDCFFLDDGKLRIRISVGRGDIGSIILHIVDKYVKPEILDTRSAIEMRKLSTDYARDYFCADIDLPQTAAGNPDMLCLRYYFEIRDFCGAVIWYGDSRFFPGEPTDIECMFDCPVLSRLEQTFRIPAWAKSAVVYQIFPSRYATTEDVPEDVWYKAPIGHKDDLKGNLRGITDHLPHIKEMGVDVVYLTPIFKSNTSHKYDTIDYYSVDPAFGTGDDLHALVDPSTTHRQTSLPSKTSGRRGGSHSTSTGIISTPCRLRPGLMRRSLHISPLPTSAACRNSISRIRKSRISSLMWGNIIFPNSISTAGVWMWAMRSATPSGSASGKKCAQSIPMPC